MAAKPEHLDCEAVLSEMGWLRGLAMSLGADAHTADDLSQATVLKVLEHPPETDRSLRGWLRTVLGNLLRKSRRTRIRREAREALAARRESGASTFDVVARAAIQRKVSDAVMALDEPYRSTVLLRFFEDLPPRRIASLLGVPVATVKTRLARALDQLRARLDRAHGGDRSSWLLCLLAPLPKAVALGTSATGVLIVQTNLKLAAAAAALTLIGVGTYLVFDWTRSDRGPAARIEQPAETATPNAAAPKSDSAGAPIRPTPYAALAEDDPAAEASSRSAAPGLAAPTAGARVRGKVIDTRSVPVESVRVVFRAQAGTDSLSRPAPLAAPASAISGKDGVFEIDAPVVSGSFLVEAGGFTTVLVGAWEPKYPNAEPVIVIAPWRKVAGRVVDESRQALAGADVAVEMPENFRSGFAHILDFSPTERWTAKTDTDGRFAFASAPDVDGATLRARLAGFEDRRDPIAAGTSDQLEIVMRRTKSLRDAISGRVVDHAGVGVPGAQVSTGVRMTLSDEAGGFSIKIDPARPPDKVVAVKEGFLPAAAPVPAGAPAEPIVLKLDGTPLTISGKVVDGDRKPLAGIQVWTPDPTLFAWAKDSPRTKPKGRDQAGSVQLEEPGHRVDGIELVENVLAGRKGDLWATIETDSDGRFVLTGLTRKEYRLHAMNPKTLALKEAGPFAAGSTDVVIELAEADAYTTVAGVVVSLGGVPVSNVTVSPQRDAFALDLQGGGRSVTTSGLAGTTTDAAGRFKLERIPKEGVYLRLEGTNTLPLDFGRDVGIETAAKGQALDHLRIEVPVRCHMRVDLGDDRDFADAVEVLGPRGRPVAIDIFLGNSRRTSQRAKLAEGHTDVLAVREDAGTVVFLKGGKEVGRKTIKLVPGSVTTVNP